MSDYKELKAFAEWCAHLKHEEDYDEDEQEQMPASEDNLAMLNAIICHARDILGLLAECDECGEKCIRIIGCPDGREICQDCFDAGIA